MPESDVIIVGGGVSGLATAYFLGQFGIRSVLIEKSNRLGGLIQTNRIEGCLLEAGPDSFLGAKPAVTELARNIQGLSGQIIGSNDAARRIFVVRSGQPVPLPRGMAMMVPTHWSQVFGSNIFSPRTKVRFFSETFMRPRIRSEDVSVGEFVKDHFGPELLDEMVEPLLAGVYGGNSGGLSARSVLPRFVGYEQNYGSLIRGVRRERRSAPAGSLFLSFREGMQTLTDALAEAARDHVTVMHAEATQVKRSRAASKGKWVAHTSEGSVESQNVVLACPTYRAAALLETQSPDLAADLAAIPYSSAILVTLGYQRAQLGHTPEGFGFLAPTAERGTIAAATWIHTKFPTRIPPDLGAVRAFIVAENAKRLLKATDAALIELVRSDLERFMNVDADPLFSTVHIWPDSMPQYVVGHEHRVRRIGVAVQNEPGLYLTGNAYDGVGVPDCIRLAKETAKGIRSRLQREQVGSGVV